MRQHVPLPAAAHHLARRFATAAGGAGGSGSSPLKAAPIGAEQRAAVAAKPRRTAFVAGPKIGAFSRLDNPHWRASYFPAPKGPAEAVQLAATLKAIDETGHLSGRRRGVPAEHAIPDAPGQAADAITPEQIRQYSGVKGGPAYPRGTDIVGVNKRLAHTLEVGGKTAGLAATLPGVEQALDKGVTGRLDEVSVAGPKKWYPVSGAFAGAFAGQNRHPIEGEQVTRGEVGPDVMGFRGKLPLDEGVHEERYLANLAKASGSTADRPQRFKVTRNERPETDPSTGRPFVSESFTSLDDVD